MKNRILTDALREVRHTLSRFLSIFILSALAVAFLAGLRTTAPDMQYTADDYYDSLNLMDVHILSTLGVTDDDLSALESQPGVLAAEGAYTVDAIWHGEDNDLIVKALSITQRDINLPQLLEGRLPANARECLVEPAFLTKSGLSIGDSITLDTGDGDFEDALAHSTFTIVGTANSPLYLSTTRGSSSLGTGKVAAFVLLPPGAFDLETYTDAYLLGGGLEELMCYGDDYEAAADALIDALEPLGDQRSAIRYDQVMDDAQQALADAQQEYDDAAADVEQELADAWQELADARADIDQGWRDFRAETADAYQKIADAEAELSDALIELNDGESEYADGLKEYEDGLAEYEDGRRDLLDGEDEYNDSLELLESSESQYQSGLKDYEDGLAQVRSGYAQLEEAKRQLDDAEQQLLRGERQLSQGYAELEGYQNQLTEAQAGKAAAEQGLSQINSALENPYLPPEQRPALEAKKAELTGTISMLGGAISQLEAGIAQGQAQLSAGAAELAAGEEQYRAGKRQYESSKRELDDAYAQLQDAGAELSDTRAELDEGWAALADGRAELDDGWAELEDARQKLLDAQQELSDGRQELDDGWAEYNDGLADLADAKAKLPGEIAKARRELTDAEAEYADGLQEYEDGKAEAEQELADAREEISDARRKVSEIENCKWYVLGRDTNMGYVSFQQDAERMGNLANVFPLIFFLVAALVCLTTMTRMVEEQRVQIGGLKALGYGKGAIAFKYVGYGFAASFLGGLIGLTVGCTLIPTIIFNAWKVLYTVGDLHMRIFPSIVAAALAAAALCVTGAAFSAAYAAVAAVPAQLMRPKAPPAGKRVLLERIRPLWKRLAFVQKVAFRNLFRYKKRFVMTVAGIGGCTALLITGFGLRDSIFDTLDKQYDDISTYTSDVGLADDTTAQERQELERLLSSSGLAEDWMYSYQESVSVEGPRRTEDATLFVPESPDLFPRFITLRHRLDQQAIALPDDGVVITEKLSELLGVSVGDTITLSGDQRVQATVADITENYLLHYVYLSPVCYQRLYGEPAQANVLMAHYVDETEETSNTIASSLLARSCVTSVSLIRDNRETFTQGLSGVNYAVIIITVSAAALAFVVLYNLTNINITERLRELATLKVLGFYDQELSAYIYRENVVLTVLGILAGLVMGRFLHQWLVLTVEIDICMFGRSAHPVSYVYAVVLTILFSALVNLAAHRRLKKIDMVESLKTVE